MNWPEYPRVFLPPITAIRPFNFHNIGTKVGEQSPINGPVAICPSSITRIPVSGPVGIGAVHEGICHSYRMKNEYALMDMCSLLAGKLSSIWSILPQVNAAPPPRVEMLYKKDKPMTAIIFDLDGTLIDSVGDIHAALNQMLAQAGHDPLAIETVTSFVGKGSSNLVTRVIDHVGLPDDAASHAHYLSEFLDIYTSAPAKLTTVFDHVHQVLTDFQSSGIVLGLCTNKPEAPTNVVLDAFGLTTFFGSIVGGDRLPSRKPDPAMLYLVMNELDVENCLFVGDSDVDVATAKAAGVSIALFTRGYRQTPVAELAPDFDFDHFKNLPAIAAAFFASIA